MINFFLFLIFITSTSPSLAQGEVEIDEIHEIIEDSKNIPDTKNLASELKELGHDSLDFKALLDPRVSDAISKQFDASNISLKSLDQKRKNFNEEFQGSLVSELLGKVPKLRDVVIDVVTDKKSMLGLIAILQKEKERTYLIYILISVLILNIILKMTLIDSSSRFITRFFQRIIINAFTFSISAGALYYLFSKELSPMAQIIKSHF